MPAAAAAEALLGLPLLPAEELGLLPPLEELGGAPGPPAGGP